MSKAREHDERMVYEACRQRDREWYAALGYQWSENLPTRADVAEHVKRLDAAWERAAIYRSALLRYGQHTEGCPTWVDDAAECSCGLSAIIGPGDPNLTDAIRAAVEAERKRCSNLADVLYAADMPEEISWHIEHPEADPAARAREYGSKTE